MLKNPHKISSSQNLNVILLPVLTDNYIFLIEYEKSVIIVDPALSDPVIKSIQSQGWQVDAVWITHHHQDHTGGAEEIREVFSCPIMGPKEALKSVESLDHIFVGGEIFEWKGRTIEILSLPGHTLGHIGYWIKKDHFLFSGDVLFSLGCGRLFEGTPIQMFHSLQKILVLPDDTLIFATHEYTEANGRFALSVDPSNDQLKLRLDQVRSLRQKGLPTLPTRLKNERETNPFLRTNCLSVRENLQIRDDESCEKVFKELRLRKDLF